MAENVGQYRNCGYCGKEFYTPYRNGGRKYCCNICRNKAIYKRSCERMQAKQKEQKIKEHKQTELQRLAKEARERHMTYGQYVAMLERGGRYE